MHISQFSKERQDIIYDLCFRAITRAINNGTYKDDPELDDEETIVDQQELIAAQ